MQNLRMIYRLVVRAVLAAAFVVPFTAGLTHPVAAASNDPGSVYTLSNLAAGNSILVYNRSSDGTLIFQQSYPTGGLGSGAGLGSQGALVLSENNQMLYAVNAGSNQISVFAVNPDHLDLIQVVDSGGVMPISLTIYKRWLYVLNGGGSGNITGFSVDTLGILSPLVGSTQSLSNAGVGAAPGGAEISFSPDGATLVVTEKATNLIDTFKVENGVAGAPVTHPSSGTTPFGFAFDSSGTLVVSEAFDGQPGLSALSSYRVQADEFDLISPSVGTTQTAACWVVISKNGKFAYTTNAGSASISSYQIGKDGSISLLNPTAGLTGGSPIDMAVDNSGSFLYALSAGGHSISAFRMGSDGSLVSLGEFAVPVGAVGLAAR